MNALFRRSIPLLLGGLLGTSSFAPNSLALEPPVVVSGTRIRLAPPENFAPATQFPGFMQESSNSSIMVMEMPAPFAELSSGLSQPDALKQKGMTLLSEEKITVDGQKAVLLKLQQRAYSTEFYKWVLVTGSERESVMVTATFPKTAEKRLSEPLRRSVMSTRFDKTTVASKSKTEGLTYTLSEQHEDLKQAQKVFNALLYSKGGVLPSPSVDDPVFVVAPSIVEHVILEPDDFARKRIRKTDNVTDIQIEHEKDLTIDGLTGYEIVAKASDLTSRKPMLVYQVMLFEEGTYYLMQGLVGAEAGPKYLPSFKALAESFQRKE
jgi:hypothetical protein